MSTNASSGASKVAGALRRRGILAACVGMAAAVADRLTHRGVAEAADNSATISGQTNFNSQPTVVARVSGTGDLFSVVDTSGAGALKGQGTANRYGVFGVSDSGIGLAASSQSGPGAFLDSVSSVGFQGR